MAPIAIEAWLLYYAKRLAPGLLARIGRVPDAKALQIARQLCAGLAAAGLGPADVVKCNVYLTDMDDFAAVNEVYGSYFDRTGQPPPARACVEVAALPKGARVEIDAVALAVS